MKLSHSTEPVISSSCTGTVLILILVATIYSNTLNASWHLDDFTNIVNNKKIQVTELSPSALFQSFQMPDNSLKIRIFRPVSYLSLALNWYFGKRDVTGYHMVNIGIHVLTSWFLYLFLLSLLKTPRLAGRFTGNENNVALLAAVLWAIHPIQIQAITYIIQRMAALSAMFYIIGLFCYIRGRQQGTNRIQWLFYAGSLIATLFAVGSKENAITLPLSIGLIEIVFFQNFSTIETRKKCVRIVFLATVITIAVSLLMLFTMIPDPFSTFQSLSEKRSFSPGERLMTEPRIVMNYLSQIFYPILKRFSIEHPVTISTSLFAPITTLLSVLSIAALLIFSLIWIHRFPVMSFSILFFFLNHVVESSFISLELIFEHRNYLPSFFLFLPVAIGILQGLRYLQEQNKRFMYFLCASVLTFLAIVVGMTTYIRNGVWENERTLWEDALEKAPHSARPWGSLAYYYSTIGRFDTALKLYEISLTKQRITGFFPAVILRNMGMIYTLKHDYQNALSCYDRSLSEDPSYNQSLYDKASALVMTENWAAAKNALETLIFHGELSKDVCFLMGIIFLKTDAPENALKYFRMANSLSPFDTKIYTGIGVSMAMMGYHMKADWFLRQAFKFSKKDMIPMLYMIDNQIRAKNHDKIHAHINFLLKEFSIDDIEKTLWRLSRDNMWMPVSNKDVGSLISEQLTKYSDNLMPSTRN